MLRNNPAQYKEMVKKDLGAGKQDVPPGFVMPTHADAFRTRKEDNFNMDDWADSDADDSFGGSDSDMGDFDEDDEDADMTNDDSASGDDEEAEEDL